MNKKEIRKILNKLYQNDALVETINMGGMKSGGRYALDHLALDNQKLESQLIESLGGSINEANQTPLQHAMNRKFDNVQLDSEKQWAWDNRPKPYFNEYERYGNCKPEK